MDHKFNISVTQCKREDKNPQLSRAGHIKNRKTRDWYKMCRHFKKEIMYLLRV